MAKDDWHRRTTWTDSDQREFFERLNRSLTTYNKAQYLRIQAGTLAAQDDRALWQAAIELVKVLVDEYPDESQLALAHNVAADCHLKLGDEGSAIASLRQSIEAMRTYPVIRTNAVESLGWIVATRRRKELFDEVMELFDEFDIPQRLHFPNQRFRFFTVIALIVGELGSPADAQRHAQNALDASDVSDSSLRYHKNLGLVENTDPEIISRLRKLASRSNSPGRRLMD